MLSTAIFQNVFDVFNFSIISNLFNSIKPYALKDASSKMCEQNASYLAKLSELGSKNFKQKLPESYSKSTKIAITSCEFSKLFRGSMSPDPPRAFLVFQKPSNQGSYNSIL